MTQGSRKSVSKDASARPLVMRQCMTPAPHSVGKEQPLEVAGDLMKKYGLRRQVIGIVSSHDVMAWLARISGYA